MLQPPGVESSWRRSMAATSAAGGASLLAGIPGLTRTYGPGEEEPTFAELLAACTSSAVHLEIHDVHLTSDPAYQAWLAGQADQNESAQQYLAYTDVVVAAVRRGDPPGMAAALDDASMKDGCFSESATFCNIASGGDHAH
jgi:hypothetical protein